ncbi:MULTISPECIES: glycoside hydrolase family 9 protein [unclassified Fibrobacter]|uniref:glycoside hydrolase family 9 protein n=1 Tax=unclassified Fibrobacter TaxID=2634177 RepID=UPI000D6C8C9F|nr:MULTISPECIES: glycoside hydrolase family 9 protein [unclassified Fibrobacter]PWJ68504.1 endoglucanase Cel9M [Fibrobacter sp. UWR4]PZW72104.1 endoglucanase Cel9M [Fibrobacter sp. UWR1]
MFFKKSLMAGLALFGLAATTASAALGTDDFVEAAWMTTRFYGAQRSGQGPNWLADGTNYTTSFMKDAYQGKDMTGGWFDCGDHVMFGQTQGYSAYILALAYAEFTEGFYDLYTGDFTDYKAANDYTRKGGKPNKVRDLLEELRYEADFWVKAAPDEKTFISVKGDGNADHMKWVTPGKMSTLGSGNGGDTRSMTANANDSYSSGMAAAMLAVMARVDPDESNRAKYLKGAKNAYAYAMAHKGVTTSGSFYNANWWNGRVTDGQFLAALELYRTTKDSKYKSAAEDVFYDLDFSGGASTPMNYANAIPLSVIVGHSIGIDSDDYGAATPKMFLDKMYKNKAQNSIFIPEKKGSGDFPVRSPSGGAFLYALYAKYYDDDSYDSMIEKNIAYLLGDNNSKKSYVVGFTANGANAPTAPHHRGYYANEDEGREVDSGLRPPEKNKLLGGMIAGDFNSGSHNGTVSNYSTNEVCVDLNAPLVGALGYILSKKAPKSDAVLGTQSSPLVKDTTTQNPSVQDTTAKDTSAVNPGGNIAIGNQAVAARSFRLVNANGVVSVASANAAPFKVQVFDLNGNMVQSMESKGREVFFLPKAKGVLQVRVTSRNAKMAYTIKSL